MNAEDLLKIIGDKDVQLYMARAEIARLQAALEAIKVTQTQSSAVPPSAEQNRLKDGS